MSRQMTAQQLLEGYTGQNSDMDLDEEEGLASDPVAAAGAKWGMLGSLFEVFLRNLLQVPTKSGCRLLPCIARTVLRTLVQASCTFLWTLL